MEAGSETAAAPHNTAPAPLGDAASNDLLQGVCLPSPHALEEEEEERRPQPVERAGWEDAIALMTRGADVFPELPAESSLRSCTSTASMKVKNVKKLSLTKGHFPRLAECAHFHYENVDFGSIQLSLARDQNDLTRSSPDSKELVYLVQICCQGRKWIVRRSYEDFRVLDKHLHLCIYDRRFSRLAELPRFDSLTDNSEFQTFAVYKQIWLLTKKDMVEVVDGDKWVEVVDGDKWDADNINPLSQMLTAYLSRLSAIADNKINCGPALTWMEIDNKGNHLLVHDESSINVPAVAAAHVIKRYIAQAADELSFEVGDIVSVIDMPPKEDTGWWRGKHGFQVGFFPCECVELISEKVPPHVTSSLPKPVSKKHGKLITFLRTFMKSRPTKQKLKQRGILRERVFGCDLGEHLLNSGHDVPQVIKSCTEFIEKHGVVDGIYRLSGIASNIQKLRHEFDSEHIPDLTKDAYIQDIHSVGSLCKLYFRELPNPLLTYQLYDKFSDAVSAATDDERLVKIHDVIQQLPPPHYRTLEFLMRHLARMATFSYVTNMHCKNLAIVWAPNLLRSKQIESACFSGTSAFMEVRIQSVVVEFILNHVDVLFSPKLSTLIRESIGHSTLSRPKSLLVCSPSTKLLSLEEAQARTQAQLVSPVSPDSKYIEVGEGPGALQGKFHTIIEFPMERKKAQTKVKKSPVASWRSFFNMGKSSTTAKRKLHRHPSEPNEIKTMALPGGRGDTGTLRSAKSEESLSSHNLEGGSGVYRPRRPRSTSDALSSSFNEELLNSRVHRDFHGSQKDRRKDPAVSTSCVPALISPPHSADAVLGMASPDFDPLSFHCNAPPAETTVSDGKKRGSRRKNGGSSSELNKVTSDILTSDAIPKAKEDANHRQSSSGKFVPAIKAKVELESSESLPEGLAQNSEEALEMKGLSLPPTQEISPVIKPSESVRGDEGQYKPASSCQTTGENMDETHSEQAQPVKQAESGAVTFDCTPGLVRSVSLITPQPAVKSAARMLALALAESAQQATQLRKRGSSEPPTPISPVHLQDPLSLLQWPPPSSLQPQTSTKRKDHCANCKHLVGPSSTISTGSRTDAGSLQSTCACHGSESGLSYSDGGDVSSTSHGTNVLPKNLSAVKGVDTQQAPESHVALRDNVRHVGVGTEGGGLCQNSEMDYKSLKPSLTRTESLLHTTESQSATAALLSKQIANASNFRAILAEASMPASVHEVLPHVPVSPPSFRCSPKEENILKSSGHMLHRNWSGPVGQNAFYIQPDYVQRQAEIPSKDHYSTLAPRSLHQSIKYKGQYGDEYSPSHFYRHGGPRYPPMDGASVYPTIRRVRSMHAPPEDKFFLLQHPSCQNNPYQMPVPSDIHHVRPYFEDGKVQYRYSPYSEPRYNNVDQYRVDSHGYSRSYTLRRLPSHPGRVMSSTENYHNPRLNPPFSREASFIKQDVGPRETNTALYEPLDSSFFDQRFSHSNRQGNIGKRCPPEPAMPQPHFQKGTRRCHETMHTRSKSDSGKDLLISTEGADGKYRVTMVSHYSPEHPLSEPDITLPVRLERQGSGPGAKTALMLKQSRSMVNYPQHILESQPLPRNLTLHKEYSCPDFKYTDPSEGSSARFHNQDKPMYKTLRSYPKEEYQYAWVKGHDLQRSERSQSVKSRQPPGRAKMTLERDHRLSYPIQNRTRTHSMFVPSRSDYIDSYVSVQAKVPKPSRLATGVFPNYGCMPPHSKRLYSTAAGQGGFLHSELRPEREIYAE